MLSVMFDDQKAREWVDGAELRESQRSGVKRPKARETLAKEWGVSFWTLTNLLRKRTKGLRGETRDRIYAGVLLEMQQEINRLNHEFEMARQAGARLSDDEVLEISTALAQARALLKSDAQ